MLWKQLSLLTLILGLASFTAQAADNAAEGKTLYRASCTSCHGDMPGKMMGMPAASLAEKLTAFKTKEDLSGKALTMQKVLEPMTEQQIMSISTYLETLKK